MIRLLMACVLLSGCAAAPVPETIRVPVEVVKPIYVKAVPPGELARPYKPVDLPEFVSPEDKSAIVALTPEGLKRLQVILRTLVTREEAWRAWARKDSE